MSRGQAFDADRALEMVEGDVDLFVQGAHCFLEQNLEREVALRDAVARRDAPAVCQIAHALVGAARNFAADDAERCAAALEETAAAGDTPALAMLLERLEAALSDLAAELTAHCTRHELRQVLIAEDDDATRKRLEHQLTKWGYRVTAVSRGDLALELLSRPGPPHLALIDWMMPGLDGLELCRALRERDAETYTYLIVITARREGDAVVQGLEAGADDFIAKPVSPNELRLRMRAGQRIIELQERLISSRDEQRRHADRDGLTGLLSRRRVFQILEKSLEERRATDGELSVVMLDLDNFKRINEEHGHAIGDRALRLACQKLATVLRRTDSFGRYGGDELVAVLPDTNCADARMIAERMRETLTLEALDCGELRLDLSVSLGVAGIGEEKLDSEGLLKAADLALYHDKSNRRETTPAD